MNPPITGFKNPPIGGFLTQKNVKYFFFVAEYMVVLFSYLSEATQDTTAEQADSSFATTIEAAVQQIED